MSAEPPYLSGDCPVEEQGRNPGRVMAGMIESHAKTKKETRKELDNTWLASNYPRIPLAITMWLIRLTRVLT